MKRQTFRKLLLAFSLLSNLLFGAALLFVLVRPEALLEFREHLKGLRRSPKDPVVAQIVEQLKTENQSSPNPMDTARTFVHSNSVHKEGTSYHRQALVLDNRYSVLRDLLRHSKGAGEPPELSCTPRTWALLELVEEMGLPWRLVVMYFAKDENLTDLSSHTFLEIRHPESGRWEVHDPTFDTNFYGPSGKRLSSLEALLLGPEQVQVKDSQGQEKPEYRQFLDKPNAFRAVRFGYLGKERQPDILLYDDDLFAAESLKKTFSGVRLLGY